MKKIKLGFVGGGFNGQIGFIENFSKNNNCKIWGLVEIRTKLRKKISKKYKIKNQYLSHHALIRDIKKFDAIVIVAKRDMTPAIAYDFLKLGKPILTEKPMASNLIQAKKLLKISKKKKVLYKIGYNKIYDEGIEKAKKVFDNILKKKTLGSLIFIKSHRLSGSGYSFKNSYLKTNEKNFLNKPRWTSIPKWLPVKYTKSYTKFLNLYCHNINLLKFFTNQKPKILFSNLSDKKMSTVFFDYGNYSAVLETGFFTKKGWDETFEIYFERGHIKVILPPQHHKNVSSRVFVYENDKNRITKEYSFKSWSFKRQSDSFLEDIQKRKITRNSAKQAVEDIEVVEKIWKKFVKKYAVRKDN